MAYSSLVATTPASSNAWAGVSLVDGFQGLHQSVSNGGWVDGMLAGGAFAADAAATVIDPFSALLANGLGWVMEHFEPLREVLDKLTGRRPETWCNSPATSSET